MTTREQIIAAAKEAGFQVIFDGKFGRDDYFSSMASIPSVERFYAIAFEAGRKAERGACIEFCDEQAEKDRDYQIAGNQPEDYVIGYLNGCGDCGHGIHARGVRNE